MSHLFHIHPDNPQLRLVRQICAILRDGGVIAYPTDTSYALGCCLGDKSAIERIRSIRGLDKEHNFTLVCRDLSELSTYARVDNPTFRLLKAHTPGPYTFILHASAEVPKRLQHPKRRTIGLRIPEHKIIQAILEELAEPLMSVTLILPDSSISLADPDEIYDRLQNLVDAVIDGGHCGIEPTTVVDLTGDVPKLLREGKGDVTPFH